MSTEDTTTTMTRDERRELKAIVKGRMDLLVKQLENRETEIARAVKIRLTRQADAKIVAAAEKLEELRERARQLEREVEAFAEEAKTRGVMYANRFNNYEKEPITVSIDDHGVLIPVGLDRAIAAEIEEIKRASGFGELDLEQTRLELLEELAAGSLASTEARGFLDRIPSVDRILPLPDDVTPEQIVEGSAKQIEA